MNNQVTVTVGPISRDEARTVSDLVVATIRPLEYYNDRARAEEIAKYGPMQLNAMIEEDPDSVLAARSTDTLAGRRGDSLS